jgi:hypothetical protein
VEPPERGAQTVDAIGQAFSGGEAHVLTLVRLRDIALVKHGPAELARLAFVGIGNETELA